MQLKNEEEFEKLEHKECLDCKGLGLSFLISALGEDWLIFYLLYWNEKCLCITNGMLKAFWTTVSALLRLHR